MLLLKSIAGLRVLLTHNKKPEKLRHYIWKKMILSLSITSFYEYTFTRKLVKAWNSFDWKIHKKSSKEDSTPTKEKKDGTISGSPIGTKAISLTFAWFLVPSLSPLSPLFPFLSEHLLWDEEGSWSSRRERFQKQP